MDSFELAALFPTKQFERFVKNSIRELSTPTQKEVRAKESSVRQKASRRGYRATKLREGNRHYLQYGPWMLTDAYTNCVVAHGLDLDGVEECLTE